MNRVVLIGRITKDPELRYTQTGIPTASFSLAVDRVTRDVNGNRQADFFNCVAWRNQADFLSRFIRKGYLLAIEGRLQSRTYQGQDGQTRYVTEVVVDSLENLQPRDPNAQPMNPAPTPSPSYPTQNHPTAPAEEVQTFQVDVADDDLPF